MTKFQSQSSSIIGMRWDRGGATSSSAVRERASTSTRDAGLGNKGKSKRDVTPPSDSIFFDSSPRPLPFLRDTNQRETSPIVAGPSRSQRPPFASTRLEEDSKAAKRRRQDEDEDEWQRKYDEQNGKARAFFAELSQMSAETEDDSP